MTCGYEDESGQRCTRQATCANVGEARKLHACEEHKHVFGRAAPISPDHKCGRVE